MVVDCSEARLCFDTATAAKALMNIVVLIMYVPHVTALSFKA